MNLIIVILAVSYCMSTNPTDAESDLVVEPIVIAHRGASGYLPEHTEGAKVLALAQGADYIEQDVVLSKDNVFVVSHDITMEETTDVEERFPDRKRNDGRYYFADFNWNEIQSLSVHERTNRKTGLQAFTDRFPGSFHQKLMRLDEEIKLIQGWNQKAIRKAGIYVELKSPAWHQKEFGYSMCEKLLPLLASFGYRGKADLCFLQCFEADELKKLKSLGCDLRTIQLTGGQKPKGLADWSVAMKEIKSYADGVGPSIEGLVELVDGQIRTTGFVEAAKEAGLLVHPYTVRKDQLPAWSKSVEDLQRLLIRELKVDGFFTDFPDLARSPKE